MFTIIAWIIIGLIAGAIAKAILPGRQGGGWLGALICGVIGAQLPALVGALLQCVGDDESPTHDQELGDRQGGGCPQIQ